MSVPQVSILFARHDSIYKAMPGCDVYDIERDARTWTGGTPVVAHPPCRAWGRLRTFANPLPGERELALWAVSAVRTFGGVLEHPAASQLWKVANLPFGESRDPWGGYTISIDQFHFGHRARKATWLYIVGCPPRSVPTIPLRMDAVTHVVQSNGRQSLPHISKAEREQTPVDFAHWLCELARMCNPHRSA